MSYTLYLYVSMSVLLLPAAAAFKLSMDLDISKWKVLSSLGANGDIENVLVASRIPP